MSRETRLRRQFAWFFTLTLAGITLAVMVSELLGALVVLPTSLGLVSVIHRLGRLGSD